MCKTHIALLIMLSIPTAFARAGQAPSLELRGSVYGGTSIQDLKSESYDAKLLPAVGGSFTAFLVENSILNYGLELSFEHNFRSNADNFYYYASYERFAMTPLIELVLPGRGVRPFISGGFGVNIAFSGYANRIFVSSNVSTGLRFKKSFFYGILASYTHGFLADYRAFETFKLGLTFRLFEKEIKEID